MLQKNNMLNLRLFDTGAPAGGAPAATGGAASGESSQTAPSVAGKASRANPLAKVQYGKDPSISEGITQADHTPAAAEKPTTITTSDTLEARKAEFEKLIKSEYKDLFDERIQTIINKRFGETKKLESRLEKISPLMQMLADKYGVNPADTDKLVKAIEDDDSYYEQEATEKGLTVEQLKEFKRMERENARFRAAQEELERRQKADEVYAQWMQQAEEVKALYPSFDLQEELQNENFLKMLTAGVDLKAAYQALHMHDILGGAMQYTAQTVQKQIVENIRARASRPPENGLDAQPGVVVKNDVAKLDKADRREIARRAQRGEVITF